MTLLASVRTLLGLGVALPCVAAVAQDAHADARLIPSLSQARESGCDGRRAPAFRSPAALGDTARRVARGVTAMEAAKASGYRATRMFQAHLSGYASPAAVARAMAQSYCGALTDPKLVDAGVHREGNSWWIVLAAPVDVPRLSDAAAVAARVLALTNDARSQPRRCGTRDFAPAPPLRFNALLEKAALLHASDMATNSYLEHEGRDGSTAAQRATSVGYRWRNIGENIAAGQDSPEQVMQDWLKSPQHCSSIMEPAFTEMGVAFAVNMRSTSVVYWAQEFGRPR